MLAPDSDNENSRGSAKNKIHIRKFRRTRFYRSLFFGERFYARQLLAFKKFE